MRRSLAAVLVALSTTVTALPVLTTTAQAAPAAAVSATPRVTLAEDPAQRALQRAGRALDAPTRARPASARPDASLALRELFDVRGRLTGEQRLKADALLARPTEGAADPFRHGYSVPATRKCRRQVCLHWVKSTADAPPSTAWAMRTLAMMNKVWDFEVGELGYRRPRPDVQHSSSPKFDVYLKDLGSQFVYGYCAPEYAVPGSDRVASGFCVLDNDFAKAQFGAPPLTSLRVTAAHEFFHAVQFAYDFREDTWLMESTATWMEERFADSANDNRRYLEAGQVRLPSVPLDLSLRTGASHYGNWPFWEYLSRRHGRGIVKRVWEQAGAYPGAPDRYSTKALAKVLEPHRGLAAVFTAYAAANAVAARSYPEGRAWPAPEVARRFVLGRDARTARLRPRIHHLAAQHVVLRPDDSLTGRKWRLRVSVDAPGRAASGRAYLTVKTTEGRWIRRPVVLDRRGRGRTSFVFTRGTVRAAIVTLVNADARFRCGRGRPYSCGGRPRGDNRLFTMRAVVLRR